MSELEFSYSSTNTAPKAASKAASKAVSKAVSKAAAETKTADTLSDLLSQGWLKQDQIWRASKVSTDKTQKELDGVSTGYESLDPLLANQGWPSRGLTEILHEQPGLGELRLLTPALAHLSQNQNRWIIWVSPPYIPYAPALSNAGINLKKLLIVTPKQLKDQLWVLEKALASSSCSAVLAWPEHVQYKQLRRLQVASKTGDCMGILYRSSRSAKQASPAELRIELQTCLDNSALSDRSVVNLRVLKRKGSWPTESFPLTLQDKLNQLTPEFDELNISQWQQPQPDLVYMEQLGRNQHVF